MLNPTVAVPVEIDDAIRAEAERTGLRRHEIVEDWFIRTWPDYVACNLRRDLGRASRVIDVAAQAVLPALGFVSTDEGHVVPSQNGPPKPKPRGEDDLGSTPGVELNANARRLSEGSPSSAEQA